MTKVQTWWERRKARTETLRALNITERFQVTEMMGELFLTCGGYAYKRIDKNTSAEEIASMLSDARRAALDYESMTTV
jgi:hypothetical protein